MKKTIFRSYNADALRAEEGSRILTGYPIVFGERSVVLPDWEHGTVYEVVERGAIDEALINSSDVIANINHNDDHMIGRSHNGEGTLSLGIDDHGVKMELETPATVYGDIAYEGARRGDFGGMSFAFWLDPDKDISYTKEQEGGEDVYVRHINKVRGIGDVSIVTHPAYPTTDVQARSAEISKEIKEAFKELEPVKEERSAAMMRDYDELGAFINR